MRRRAASRTVLISVGAVVLVALVLGTSYEVGLTRAPSKHTSFDVQPLLSSTGFGFLLKRVGRPSPTGIASYGLYNDSGSIRPYAVSTTEVVGQASISALSTTTKWNDSTLPSTNIFRCDQCAALQMNVDVLVTTSHGNQSLWVQNVASFIDTSQRETGGVLGQIWNLTIPIANITDGSTGNGYIGKIVSAGGTQTCYCFGYLGVVEGLYTLPLEITLTTSVQVPTNHSGIEVMISAAPFGVPGSQSDSSTLDRAYLPISNVTSAGIVVSPYMTIPFGPNYSSGNYDAELVWTAYCCSQTTDFLEMNSSLSLSYLNSVGQVVPFPSFYTFGETGESAANLSVSALPGGGQVQMGASNNTYLGQ